MGIQILVTLALALLSSPCLADGTTCYDYWGGTYTNQAVCPGSQVCCSVEASCTDNKMCQYSGVPNGTFYRPPCAQNPYNTTNCSPICLYQHSGGLPEVTQCADGTWCCDEPVNTTQCCEQGNGVRLDAAGNLVSSSTSSASTTSSGMTTSTSPATATTGQTSNTASNPPTSTGNAGLTAGEKAGIGAGVGVGVPLIACLAAIAILLARKRSGNNKSELTPPSYDGLNGDMAQYKAPDIYAHHVAPGELDEQNQRFELPQSDPHELEASNARSELLGSSTKP